MRGAWVFKWALIRKPTLLFLLSLAIAIFVFLKNAWVGEDSYILFRSIEQLFSGNDDHIEIEIMVKYSS